MKYTCINIKLDPNFTGKSFVGFYKEEIFYKVYTPYGFDLPLEITKDNYFYIKQLKMYAKSILKALSFYKARNNLADVTSGDSNPEVALKIVSDFIQNGLYRDYEKYECINGVGKIDFKKTITKVSPTITNEDFIFDNLVITRKNSYNGFISQVQANIINHFMLNGGELFFGSLFKIDLPKMKLTSKVIIDLKIEKFNTSNSRKLQLINWSIDYINGVVNQRQNGNWNYAIVASTLWEEMIDLCYSNQEKRDRTKYGQQYKMYYSPVDLIYGRFTQHDTICEFKDYIMIIDAKMYLDSKNLISEEILGKQFGYYDRAKDLNKSKKIFNILIKPNNPNNSVLNKFEAVIPSPEIKKTMDLDNFILIYSLDYLRLMEAYCAQRKLHIELLAEALEFEDTEDFKCLKSIWVQ